MLAGAAGFALQVVLATFSVTYAVSKGADRQGVLYAFAAASFVSIAFVVMGGRLSDKLGRRPVMIGGLVLFILYLVPMFQLLSSNNIGLIFVAFAVGLMIHSTLFGPLAAFVSEQFGTTSRYTGASLGYQLATLLGAGFTPGIVAQIFKDSGQDTGVGGLVPGHHVGGVDRLHPADPRAQEQRSADRPALTRPAGTTV